MSKVKILIVEDELIIAEDMRQMLEDLGYDVTGTTGDPEEAMRLIAATSPDLVMVDITLGVEQLGLDLARSIGDKYNIPFVFCTSHSDRGTVRSATKLHPHGYLVKPFEQKDLFSAIELALANFSYDRNADNPVQESDNRSGLIIKDSLFIKEGNVYQKVKFEDILFVSPEGNYSEINLKEGKKFIVRMLLKDFQLQLPQQRFFRTHRSYIVNLEHVSAINSNNVFVEGNEIPLGKTFRELLLNQLKKLQ